MRFIDWNGSGELDPQDIATSVVIDEAERDDSATESPSQTPNSNVGCTTLAALMALAIVSVVLAL